MKRNRALSLIIIALTYIIVCIGSFLLYGLFDSILPDIKDKAILNLFIVDVIMTVFVFIISSCFANSSIYDPYWSVMPIILITIYALKLKVIDNGFVILLIGTIFIWGIRLTANFIYTFKNLHIQDWRYVNLKEKHPALWPLINLFGIHLFPTVIVFIGLLPAFKYVLEFNVGTTPTISTYLGVIIAFLGIIIETVADGQLHSFKNVSSNDGLVCDKGLWKTSRHPNYFGEILFWIGIWWMGSSFYKDSTWILIFSPLIIFLMFVTISIPMMEKRQLETKQGYKEYMESTNMLLPIFSKKKENK